jgi:cell wall-associated NlpC family hydrolase
VARRTLGARSRLPRIAVATTMSVLVGVSMAAPATAAPKGADAPASAKRWPNLSYGERGSAVKYVQKRLGVSQTGYFGPKTLAAVKRYERRHDLTVNGVVGAQNWRAMGVPKVRTAASTASASTSKASSSGRLKPGTAAWGRAVLAEARKHKGAPYRRGAEGPRAFDCSGFVQYTIRKATGKKLPRTAAAMRAATKRIPKSKLRAGDLVFVHRGGRVSHVAIYDGKGRWWEATRPGRPLNRNKPWTSSVSYGRVR